MVSRTTRDRLDDIWDALVPFLVMGAAVACVTALFASLAFVAERASCHSKADAMGVNWSWGVFQDCMIVVDGKNIPIEAYKVVRPTQ